VVSAEPLYNAAGYGWLQAVRILVKELGADVNQATIDGCTPLYVAAQLGHLSVVQCLIKELGANVNQAAYNGATPLMAASQNKHMEVVVWLIKHGANAQASTPAFGTAANVSREIGAPADQTAYLEARTHCANPGCDGAGLKKCAGCSARTTPLLKGSPPLLAGTHINMPAHTHPLPAHTNSLQIVTNFFHLNPKKTAGTFRALV
jgi:ankyrin repeat protein